jgi:hypothetical protein
MKTGADGPDTDLTAPWRTHQMRRVMDWYRLMPVGLESPEEQLAARRLPHRVSQLYQPLSSDSTD